MCFVLVREDAIDSKCILRSTSDGMDRDILQCTSSPWLILAVMSLAGLSKATLC